MKNNFADESPGFFSLSPLSLFRSILYFRCPPFGSFTACRSHLFVFSPVSGSARRNEEVIRQAARNDTSFVIAFFDGRSVLFISGHVINLATNCENTACLSVARAKATFGRDEGTKPKDVEEKGGESVEMSHEAIRCHGITGT